MQTYIFTYTHKKWKCLRNIKKMKCKHLPQNPFQTICLAKYFNMIQRQTSTLPMSKLMRFHNDYLVIYICLTSSRLYPEANNKNSMNNKGVTELGLNRTHSLNCLTYLSLLIYSPKNTVKIVRSSNCCDQTDRNLGVRNSCIFYHLLGM